MSVPKQRQTDRPPLACGLPMAGNVLSLMGGIRAFLTERYLEIGPIFRVKAFNREYTVIAGAEDDLFVSKKGRERRLWRASRGIMAESGAGAPRLDATSGSEN